MTQNPEDTATTPEPDPLEGEHRQARPGVKDEGEIVTSAGGEKMSGLIADIADGDT